MASNIPSDKMRWGLESRRCEGQDCDGTMRQFVDLPSPGKLDTVALLWICPKCGIQKPVARDTRGH